MSTSAYYNFMTNRMADKAAPPESHRNYRPPASRIAGRSPTSCLFVANSSSFSSSSNTSSSSLNQFNCSPTTTTGATTRQQLHDSSSNCSSSSVTSTSATHNNNNNHKQQQQQQPQPPRDLQRRTSASTLQSSRHQHHSSQMFHSYTLHSLEAKPFKPFKNKSDYLEAMKEDLAEWLNQLYPDLDLSVENFFAQLETGSIICRHANNVTLMGRNLIGPSEQQQQQQPTGAALLASPNGSSGYGSINYGPTGGGPHASSHSSPTSSPSSLSSSNDSSLIPSKRAHTPVLSPRQSSQPHRPIDWFWVKMIPYKEQAKAGTFFARDNICQFILWCRSLNILECLLFETDDLVARKNEKSFILCLLEVARIGFKVGMPTPLIIQLEQEIDREIEQEEKQELAAKLEAEERLNEGIGQPDEDSFSDLDESSSVSSGGDAKRTPSRDGDHDGTTTCAKQTEGRPDIVEKKFETPLDNEQAKQSEQEEAEEGQDVEEEEEEEDYGPKPQVITNDLLSLHEKVVQLLCQCTCPTQFPMVRVGDNGKYKVGDKLIIFVRILRRHIMVRVGGGWQELSEFLRAKDPCRSKLNFNHNHNHHHHSTSSVSPLSAHHSQNNNTNNHHHGSQSIRQASLSALPRSRLPDNGQPSNGNNRQLLPAAAGFHNANANTSGGAGLARPTTQPVSSSGRHRFISGSASMSWISNNS